MDFPEALIRGQIAPRKVYRFNDTVPNGTGIISGHWHICFKVKDSIVYLLCCTTKEQTIDKYLHANHLDDKTKVYIAPTTENGLEKDTFLNCNTIRFCELDDLVKLLKDGLVQFTGEISDEEFQKIRIGILSSSVVEPIIQEFVRDDV